MEHKADDLADLFSGMPSLDELEVAIFFTFWKRLGAIEAGLQK